MAKRLNTNVFYWKHGSKYVIIAATGSTPNFDMLKFLQSSLDPVLRADLCVVKISISRLSIFKMS